MTGDTDRTKRTAPPDEMDTSESSSSCSVTARASKRSKAAEDEEIQILHQISAELRVEYLEEVTMNQILRAGGNLRLTHSSFCSFDEYEGFLEEFGSEIRGLRMSLMSCQDDPIEWSLLTSKHCPNLSSLSIIDREEGDDLLDGYWDRKNWDLELSFPKLTKLTISSGSKMMPQLLRPIIRVAALQNLILHLSSTSEDQDYLFLREILANLEGVSGLDRLTSLQIKCRPEKNRFLRSGILQGLIKLKLTALGILEIGPGIWYDANSPKLLEELLKTYSGTLTELNIHGCFGGVVTRGVEVKISIPPMPKLTSFSFQSDYEYEEILEIETPHPPKPKNIALIPATIYFPRSDTLQKLVLGQLIEISTAEKCPEFCVGAFPKLITFEVGSTWNKVASWPKKKKLQNLRELKFEDALKDPWEVRRIRNEVVGLEKITLFLPGKEVLREFFKSFADYGLKEFHIKTRFCFDSILDTILRGGEAPYKEWAARDKFKVGLLKEYGQFEAFLAHYDIQLPEEKATEQGKGLGDFVGLNKFTIEHIPRVLRIPKGSRHWTDPECFFWEDRIGSELQFLSEESRFLQVDRLYKGATPLKSGKFINFTWTKETTKLINEAPHWKEHFVIESEEVRNERKGRERMLGTGGTRPPVKYLIE